MAQHTPGPWRLSATVTDPLGIYVANPALERSSIAHVTEYENYGETEANARLIAAAPDLLAALEPFANMFPDNLPLTDPLGEKLQSWAKAARTAIAKATK